MICDNARHLLFIEPQQPAAEQPLIDSVTRSGAALLRIAYNPTGAAWKGMHVCTCGVSSGAEDLGVPDPEVGVVHVNTLLVHYLAWHRAEVPRGELAKLAFLFQHNKLETLEPTPEELQAPKVRKY